MSEENGGLTSSAASDLSDFEKGQIVGAYLGELSVEEISSLCNVSSQTVSEILDLYKLYLQSRPPALKRRASPAKPVKSRKRLRKAKTCKLGSEKTLGAESERERPQDDTEKEQQSSND